MGIVKQKKHKTGVSCNCGNNILGVFAHAGDNCSSKRIKGFGYCKRCDKIFKVELKEVGR